MKHLISIITIATLFACGGAPLESSEPELDTLGQTLPCETCEPAGDPTPSASWHLIYSSNVSSWQVKDCATTPYTRLGSGLLMGHQGYPNTCLFAGPTVDISGLGANTKLKVQVEQLAGTYSSNPVAPYYSHFYVRFGEVPLDTRQIYPMYLTLGQVTSPSFELIKPYGTFTLNPVLGFNTSVPVWSTPDQQPSMELRTVKVYAWY